MTQLQIERVQVTIKSDYRVQNILVTGHGRSGTNWLLGMFDHSDRTFCRNEANEIIDSPLSLIGGSLVRGAADQILETDWDDAIAWAAERQGQRDQDLPSDKFYLHRWCRLVDRITIARRQRLRRLLGLLTPRIAEAEWPIPSWMGRRDALSTALPVFKMALVPGWVRWLIVSRPETLVVHIVRHPGGFMNSWMNRYVAKHDPQKVLRANRERLQKVAAVESKWADMFGNIDALGLEESELWYWAYATDLIHATGDGHVNYRVIIYENLADCEIDTAQDIYAAAGLQWTHRIEEKMRSQSMMKKQALDAWRQRVSADQCEMIDKILAKTNLGRLWA